MFDPKAKGTRKEKEAFGLKSQRAAPKIPQYLKEFEKEPTVFIKRRFKVSGERVLGKVCGCGGIERMRGRMCDEPGNVQCCNGNLV